MLLTVKDACKLHPMALDYAMADQIENLSDVIERTKEDARAFFDNNFVTRGMGILLSQGLQRLSGRSDQAVFELKQAMGGGKTHSMIALGLLARDDSLRSSILPEIAKDAPFGNAKLVAVSGRLGFEDTFIWGEIAGQLGKTSEFSRFWRDGPKAPSENDWIGLTATIRRSSCSMSFRPISTMRSRDGSAAARLPRSRPMRCPIS